MARKQEKQTREGGRFKKATEAVKRLFGRGDSAQEAGDLQTSAAPAPARSARGSEASTPGRTTRRVADIPLDVLDRTYTPPDTSSKASFRSTGADHYGDQEFAMGVDDSRWKDEDQITNKSGDPRIGTHRRTYEPGEARDESRE
ncbi:MAG TPA: hypothetical protein VEK57_06955 [Thermoanaerobaculia bacterium]|nr:hypothetical protein [Thermoanaerobaculia bacterium]